MLPNKKPDSEREVYNGIGNENGDDFTSNIKQTTIAEVGLASGSVMQPSDQMLQVQQEQQNGVSNTSVDYDPISNIPLTDAGSVNVPNVAVGQAQAPQVPGNGANGNIVPPGCSDEVGYAAIFRMATAPSFSDPQLYVLHNDPDDLWVNFIDGDPNAGIFNGGILGPERPNDEFYQ